MAPTPANDVIAQTAGGSKQIINGVSTIADVKRKLGAESGYTANLNGSPADDNDPVRDGDRVILAKAVKGG